MPLRHPIAYRRYIRGSAALVGAHSVNSMPVDERIFLLLGKDLIGVQNLLKKHQALQAEIAGHEPRIKAVTQKGNAMVEEGE